MVTNYPHSIGSPDAVRAPSSDAPNGVGDRAWERLRQMFCGLHGHDTMLHFEQERMSLRCVSCGHETPGWALNKTRPTVTIRGDNRRHVLVRNQLIGARRIA